MTQERFIEIYQRAAERKGGEARLEAMLTRPAARSDLLLVRDHRWLAALTMKVFQCGIVWRIVTAKWAGFEEVFLGFNIEQLLLMSPEMWEQKAKDPRIIRHLGKVMTIPANATMIHDADALSGSFSQLVAEWPEEDIVGLWGYLKRHGKRLGGNTGPYALRSMGKDTFLLTRDVEGYLRHTGIIDSGLQSKRALSAAQQAFNRWQQESGRPLCQLSQIIAFSAGDNVV